MGLFNSNKTLKAITLPDCSRDRLVLEVKVEDHRNVVDVVMDRMTL